MSYQEVIDFWFEELEPAQWWMKDKELDQMIKQRFLSLHQRVALRETTGWDEDPIGALAEIIVLDQFSRNIYRRSAQAFAHDALALSLAEVAIRNGYNQCLLPQQRLFMYMPFMHSESADVHEQAMILFSEEGLEENLEFECKHKAIIDRFGRYPHRNAILGRESTAEELEFLQQPDSSF